jgi:hypothetical protein
MKLSINISEDKELRDVIKGLIKEQIKSVVRNEINEIIKEELSSKWLSLSDREKDARINYYLKASIADCLRNDHNVSQWSHEYINPIISELISDYIKKIDITKHVNLALKEKLKKVIDETNL